ncbi:MAG: hypothetical protein IPP29_04395 [Bacteroidetes bacterium]|nr:hypothetical protein [Bacteroidota bacterium]
MDIKANEILKQKVELVVDHKNNAGRLRQMANTLVNNLSKQFLEMEDFPTTVDQIASIRMKAIEGLEQNLLTFEANVAKQNIKVEYINNEADAKELLKNALQNVTTVYVQKNELNEELNVLEAVNGLKKNISREGTGQQLTSIVKAKFVAADPGAIISEIKTLADNTAFARSKRLIFVVSMFDVLQHVNHFQVLLPLLQQLNVTFNRAFSYLLFQNTIFKTPQAEIESVSVWIVDNGRSKILNDVKVRQLASCLHCGVCSKVCTVSKAIDNKVNYSAIHNPQSTLYNFFTNNIHDAHTLLYINTLSRAMNVMCPAGIDLQGLFLYGRQLSSKQNAGSIHKKWFHFFWKKSMLDRSSFKLLKNQSRKLVMNHLYEIQWSAKGQVPPHAKLTFNEYWRQNKK